MLSVPLHCLNSEGGEKSGRMRSPHSDHVRIHQTGSTAKWNLTQDAEQWYCACRGVGPTFTSSAFRVVCDTVHYTVLQATVLLNGGLVLPNMLYMSGETSVYHVGFCVVYHVVYHEGCTNPQPQREILWFQRAIGQTLPNTQRKAERFCTRNPDKKVLVTCEMIQVEAGHITNEEGTSRTQFRTDWPWMTWFGFMRSNGLAPWRRTAITQKLPKACEEKVLAFLQVFSSLRTRHHYVFRQIGNTDQTLLFLDVANNMTVLVKGNWNVSLLSSSLADNAKLRSYVVFKKKMLPKWAASKRCHRLRKWRRFH